MKVSELIELLEEQDPDAEVLVMTQENWPFECALAGLTTREEYRDIQADRPLPADLYDTETYRPAAWIGAQ